MKKVTDVFVGISGGVDSAVSAALLKKAGYQVTGVFIKIQIPGYPCPAAQDRLDAMRVAAHLRIPFLEVDLSQEYMSQVFKPSIQEYGEGKTPNPDTLCNREIKFGIFYEWARKQGAQVIATGHYAQIRDGLLYEGKDTNKDQSYFLALVPAEIFNHVLFPIGHLEKKEVRALAQTLGLPNASRPDSQGLCFLGDISIEDMLARELTLEEGDVLSEEGDVIGTHKGSELYTLGERHGFTLIARSPHSVPHFVIAKNTEANTITVSQNRFPTGATRTKIVLQEMNWIGQTPEGSFKARYRYRQSLIPTEMHGGSVVLLQPHYAPEGQALVVYDGERCLGGGIISSATLEK